MKERKEELYINVDQLKLTKNINN